MRLYVNGRFLSQPLSGVQRHARELLAALDDRLAGSAALRLAVGPVEVLVPNGGDLPSWAVLRPRILPGGQGHIWEQTTLWRASRDGVLLSLANSGPLRHPAQALTLHDAHIFQIPEAFSRPYRTWHRVLRPRLARRAAQLITVSDSSARQLGHFLGIEAGAFEVVPNAADHVLRLPADPEAPARYGLVPDGYLLAVGNQSPNKNILSLLQAYAACGPGVPPLALVGAQAPGLADGAAPAGARVHALGRVPDTDLRGLYEGAAGFVFPSLHEGFGIPALEAMQLGVPVLCARAGAMPEVLGDAPIWFDPRDLRSITQVLERFSAMPKEVRAMRAVRGRRQADRYSWAKSAEALMDTILPLLAPKGSEALQRHVERDGDLIREGGQVSYPST